MGHVELPEDFKVDIYSDWGVTKVGTSDVAELRNIRQAGQISHETFLKEIKRRGILSDMVDIDTEVEAAKNEGPGLGMVGTDEDAEE